MRDLTTTIHALPRQLDLESAHEVLEAASSIDALKRGTWTDHLISQALLVLREQHHVSPSPADRAEHARIASILKHIQEATT